MEKVLVLLTFLGSVIALVFALVTAKKVLKFEEGTPLMQKISASIREGANAYLKRQYTIVAIFFACMFVVLCIMAATGLLTWFVPFAFVTGGFFSGLSGFIGMRIATKANCRTANACRTSLNRGLRVAFSAGSVMGFTVVGLGLLDISIWFTLLKFVFKLDPSAITSAMLTFGMGASSMALFARVGGGIYTKAADVGADLVGKVEAGIPEDDPRNPAVIADNVGDNVGDVAGMGADLYESYVGSIISASALGVAAFGGELKAMALPMIMAALGILASIIGTFFVRTGESTDQRTLLSALRRGTNLSALIIAVAAFFLIGSKVRAIIGTGAQQLYKVNPLIPHRPCGFFKRAFGHYRLAFFQIARDFTTISHTEILRTDNAHVTQFAQELIELVPCHIGDIVFLCQRLSGVRCQRFCRPLNF